MINKHSAPWIITLITLIISSIYVYVITNQAQVQLFELEQKMNSIDDKGKQYINNIEARDREIDSMKNNFDALNIEIEKLKGMSSVEYNYDESKTELKNADIFVIGEAIFRPIK